MKTMTVEGKQIFAVHQIDHENSSISKVNIKTIDFQKFTTKLFAQDLAATNKRGFKFSRESTELSQIVESLISNSEAENFDSIFEAKTDQLAKKLLDAQIKAALRNPGINPPKKGSLVVIYLKKENQINLLISKIDQAIFMNLEDSLYKAGLPEEKATQKTCSISFQLVGEEYQLIDIIVSDSKPKIATFWYDDFLELKELNTNERNTLNAFNAIDNVLSSYVKRQSKRDYTELRNTLTGYFKTKTSFKFDDMVEYVIGDYSPENDKINIEGLKESLKKLPEKKDFDTSFNIVVSQIKARFKRSYKVTEKIELRTSDYIEDLKNVILAQEDEYGEKVLIIKHIDEDLYNTFKLKEED
ncbi:hypothetical protein [Peribacillus phoenicis]|uniref:hypothetical protein n=1 Tax=unclassified Peribacillus TaxID=2675266 RepID=UPI0039A1AF81